jgi:hypothetical protein
MEGHVVISYMDSAMEKISQVSCATMLMVVLYRRWVCAPYKR